MIRRTVLAMPVIALVACSSAAPRGTTTATPAIFAAPAAGTAVSAAAHAQSAPAAGFGMVIHGGAGTIRRGSMTPAQEAEYLAALEQALRAGHRILSSGGSSLDAVEAAVRVMEDSPLFNSARGAVFTSEGRNELDASIMDGSTLRAGAVAGVTHTKNPITLARRVMENSPHVMMIGDGAEKFGREQGIEMVEPSYFFTENRWNALRRALEAEGKPMPPRPAGVPPAPERRSDASALHGTGSLAFRGGIARDDDDSDRKFGTVGAVALDRNGNIAAATSTGGMTNKRFGRVGDAPIIGAGTYANGTCGVSATGHGEYFIRNVVAYDICARMQYTGESLARAAHVVVMERLVSQQAEGGIIAMDAQGNHAMTFNSEGMYRGYIDAAGNVTVAIYRD